MGRANHPPPLWDVVNHPPPLEEAGAAVCTLPMSDTVKEVVDGKVRRTVPRETLVQVIGPWIFDRDTLADALARVAAGEAAITDMIGLCQAARLRVRTLPVR